MRFDDLITMCWRLVLRNRRRYKAVMAGIALGTAGFIIMQTLGDSVERKMGDNLELLGEATILKAEWDNDESYHPGQYYMKDVARIRKLHGVVAVAPIVSLPQVDAFFRTTQWTPGLFGVDHSYWRTQTCNLQLGRLIGPSDVVGRKTICVMGKDAVKELFPNVNPLGQTIRVGNLSFRVVGVLGGIQHTYIRRGIFIPISTAQNLFRGLYWIRTIYIRVDNWDAVEKTRDLVERLLRASHPGYEDGIRVIHYPKRIERVRATVYIVKLFVWAALSVTLVLGGLGVTNVMLAAVQDRTSEIGLRKALGAKEEVILLQFLTESVLISFIVGIVRGCAGSHFGATTQRTSGPGGLIRHHDLQHHRWPCVHLSPGSRVRPLSINSGQPPGFGDRHEIRIISLFPYREDFSHPLQGTMHKHTFHENLCRRDQGRPLYQGPPHESLARNTR